MGALLNARAQLHHVDLVAGAKFENGEPLDAAAILPTGGRLASKGDGEGTDVGGTPNTPTRDPGASLLSEGRSAGGARVAIGPVRETRI